ncbi:MAG: response regulator containing a CheY-like receiver domain and an DNA-binding domain [Bacteroidetes bacterium]|nr:response regulator containing a CheY-like receiver domain and an DNA-binding domain [Bacteroidota bacterium]
MKKKFPRFIIIDNEVNALVLSQAIRTAIAPAEIRTFNCPEAALKYIVLEYSGKKKADYAMLFMDIDLYPVTIWEFLEKFEELDHKTRSFVSIVALSFSCDLHNKERAFTNKHVKNYLEKPLTTEVIEQMFL